MRPSSLQPREGRQHRVGRYEHQAEILSHQGEDKSISMGATRDETIDVLNGTLSGMRAREINAESQNWAERPNFGPSSLMRFSYPVTKLA